MSKRTRSGLQGGLALASLFVVFGRFGLRSVLVSSESDAQVAVALLAAPASAWLWNLYEPLVANVAKVGTPNCVFAGWAYLILAGAMQYFLVGFLVMQAICLFREKVSQNRTKRARS